MGQRDRPEVLDLGQRVAGGDQVAQVPEAAAERAAGTNHQPAARPAPACGRQRDHGDASAPPAIASTVTLVPGGEARGEPGGGERPADRQRGSAAPSAPARGCAAQALIRIAIAASSSAAATRSFFAAPGLAHDQRVALEQDRRRDDA